MADFPAEIELFLYRTLDKAREYQRGIKACCPFHAEDTPSFFIFYSDKMQGWFWKCFGCPADRSGGTLHGLLRKLQGPFELVVRPSMVVQRVNRELDEAYYLPDSTTGLPDIYDYFLERGISPEVCQRYGFKQVLGPEPAAVMPVYFQWTYCGHIRRYLNPAIKYRYEIEPGADLSKALWGWDDIDPALPTFITEGIIDAATFITLGYQAIALVTGKKWQGKEDTLKQLRKPIGVPDNGDSNSIDSFFQLAMKTGGSLLLLPPDVKDANALFHSHHDFNTVIEDRTGVKPTRVNMSDVYN